MIGDYRGLGIRLACFKWWRLRCLRWTREMLILLSCRSSRRSPPPRWSHPRYDLSYSVAVYGLILSIGINYFLFFFFPDVILHVLCIYVYNCFGVICAGGGWSWIHLQVATIFMFFLTKKAKKKNTIFMLFIYSMWNFHALVSAVDTWLLEFCALVTWFFIGGGFIDI